MSTIIQLPLEQIVIADGCRVVVVVAIRRIEGAPFFDIRRFVTDEDGSVQPSRNGVSVAVIRAPGPCDGVTKAVTLAQQLGLLKRKPCATLFT